MDCACERVNLLCYWIFQLPKYSQMFSCRSLCRTCALCLLLACIIDIDHIVCVNNHASYDQVRIDITNMDIRMARNEKPRSCRCRQGKESQIISRLQDAIFQTYSDSLEVSIMKISISVSMVCLNNNRPSHIAHVYERMVTRLPARSHPRS